MRETDALKLGGETSGLRVDAMVVLGVILAFLFRRRDWI